MERGEQGRQRGGDAQVGGDRSRLSGSMLDRDVEVLADQDALAGKVEVAHSLDGHGVIARERKSGGAGQVFGGAVCGRARRTSLSGYPQRQDRKSTRLNSSHYCASRMQSSA